MLLEKELSDKRLKKALRRKGMGYRRSRYLQDIEQRAINYMKLRQEVAAEARKLQHQKDNTLWNRMKNRVTGLFRRNSK